MIKTTFVATMMAVFVATISTINANASERVEQCVASWYGPGFHGRKMANGQQFNQNNPMHLAHKTLPFGTVVEVINERNGRTLRAVVTDRGPYIRGRCVDVSEGGAKRLGFRNSGTAPVRVRVIN